MSASVCPVCRAALRGSGVCGRCKADLSWPLALATRAWRLRQQGWAALLAGEVVVARERAVESLGLEECVSARRLQWLAEVVSRR